MDTNSKSNNKISKWIVGLISVLIIGMISGWLYSEYDKMGQITKQRGESYYNSELYDYLAEMNYTLYLDTLEQVNPNISNEELFKLTTKDFESVFDDYGYYGYYDITGMTSLEFEQLSINEQYQVLMNSLRASIENRFSTSSGIFSQLKNLDYLAVSSSNDFKIGNLNLDPLINKTLSSSKLEEFTNQYQCFVVLSYDKNGNLEILTSYGLDSNLAYSGIKYSYIMETSNYELLPIKDMTFVYAIPKVLTYHDYIWDINYRYDWWSLQEVVGYFSLIAISLTAISSIILPINPFKQSKIFNTLLKVPVEIMGFLSLLLFPIFIELVPSVVSDTLEIRSGAIDSVLSEEIIALLNIAGWIVLLYFIFLGCMYIKNIFKVGIKETIKTQFISVKLLRWSIGKSRLFYRWVMEIDLKNQNTKKLALVLGIQCILISLMCLGWFFGLFGAILYTGILFIYLNKKLKKVQSDYSKLFVITNEIAEGNLDVEIDQDLGIFNSFKDEVVSIQGGLKKAVQNEVKSQRMKTDLIANVSHDLKTPLTSIITYIDLLKDDNLEKEKREQYLETLDQKSQRLKILIEDLFEMSKASSGNISMNLQQVDVVALIKQTLLETEDKIEEAGLMIRRQLPDNKIMLSLDSERTFRVFENLISNMTKYAMPGTRAYVDIVDNENDVQVIFKNISAEEITVNVDELVERFVRGDQSRHTEGSGLGLAIAKSFVELQGGRFEVQVDGDLFKVIVIFNK